MLKAILLYINDESKIMQTMNKPLTYRNSYRLSEIRIAPNFTEF